MNNIKWGDLGNQFNTNTTRSKEVEIGPQECDKLNPNFVYWVITSYSNVLNLSG